MAPTSEWVLAIDLGTGGPKVALVGADGEVLSSAAEPTPLIHVPGGGVEQDPATWWLAIRAATQRVVSDGRGVGEIVAVAVTSQWLGSVPVDADGNHLANAIIWMDARGGPHSRAAIKGVPTVPTTPYGAAKVRRWLKYTGGAPSPSGRDSVGHMLYLAAEEPELHERTHTYLEPMDYLNARLTGRLAASWDTACATWVTDNRDLSKVSYVPELIEMTGLDAAKLPELVPTGSFVGNVTDTAAADLGIDAGIPVLAGMPDSASAAIGSGATRDGEAHLYVGTSSWISCHVDMKKVDILHTIASLPSGIPGRYLASCEQQTAGSCLTHLIDDLLYPDDGLGGPAPHDVYDRIMAVAEDVPAGANGVVYTPWLNGERSPIDDETVRAGFHHLSLTTTRADLVRALLEGVAHNSRWLNSYVEKFVGRRFDRLNFIGGGAQSPVWAQIFADVLDRDIVRMAEPRLANARGVAWAAWNALGAIDWNDIPDLVAIAEVHRPDGSSRRAHDTVHSAFTDLHSRNRKIHARLTKAQEAAASSG